MSFFNYFFDTVCEDGETAVCCPFPHTVANGSIEYLESTPSAHVNVDKGVFHCMACNKGYNEEQFIVEVLQCSYTVALYIRDMFKHPDVPDKFYWDEQTNLMPKTKQLIKSFNITDEVIKELDLKSSKTEDICFPAFIYNKILDIRTYAPGQTPKIKSLKNSKAGLIIPFDIWRQSSLKKTTILCAGEKDMAVARSNGLNAITLTGGENTLPILLKEFANRKVVIVYDNDEAGIKGAVRLANYLRPYCLSLKNCTAFHEVCKENKEDITDFFNKYGKTKEDLIKYIEKTPEWEVQVIEDFSRAPIVDLHTASSSKYVGRLVRSNIQVVATAEAAFITPTLIVAEKWRVSEGGGSSDKLNIGDIREWRLNEKNIQDLLYLIDSNLGEVRLEENYKDLLKIQRKEPYVRITHPIKETVFKAYVTDLFETAAQDTIQMEYTAYSLRNKLESGKKYLATYKLVPHPYKGQELIMIIVDVVQANDSVTNYMVTSEEIDKLEVFKKSVGTIEDRIVLFAEKFKGLLGYDGNRQLITALDLAFHTPLMFNFGNFTNLRAYLDIIVVGESRMGKSSTAETMRNTYGLGAFVSLAGNAATIPGLVGGSNKVNNSFQTRAGLIPQNHKGLIIFEELGKCHSNIISELTDIRSSGEVRITRVSGTLTLPALVRMISLSNVKSSDGIIRPISTYPHGISILTDLIETAEDIARYDYSVVLGDRGAATINPFWKAEAPFTLEQYRARIRWIWSRQPHNIKIDPDVEQYIIERANALNKLYTCHIKIFGTEAWKKIARVATAVAGYLVSTDNYEDILVLKEHVDYACGFLVSLYDNPVFKLKEYVEYEKKYSETDSDAVTALQNIFNKSPSLVLHLEQCSSTTKNASAAAAGLTNDAYNVQINKLVAGYFVIFSKYEIIPTQRFRNTIALIDRRRILAIGEIK